MSGAVHRRAVELAQACRLINHGPTMLVSSAHDGRRNVMAAQADARVFEGGHWPFCDGTADLHTLHHLGGGQFALPSATVQGRKA